MLLLEITATKNQLVEEANVPIRTTTFHHAVEMDVAALKIVLAEVDATTNKMKRIVAHRVVDLVVVEVVVVEEATQLPKITNRIKEEVVVVGVVEGPNILTKIVKEVEVIVSANVGAVEATEMTINEKNWTEIMLTLQRIH